MIKNLIITIQRMYNPQHYIENTIINILL